jgi:hypothetical protein
MELFTKLDLAEGKLQSLKTRPDRLKPDVPPPPAIERTRVVLRERSKWREPDGSIRTGGRHTEMMLPADTAERAMRNGLVVDPTSEVATRLRAGWGVEYQPFAPMYAVVDLDGEPEPKEESPIGCRS